MQSLQLTADVQSL